MSVNSSSSSNASTSFSLFSSICYNYRSSVLIFTVFSSTNILLLLPLCILVLHLGLRRCRKHRSASKAASHSDVFTYHMVAVEMVGVFGCWFYCCGVASNVPWLMLTGACLFSITANGQMIFHTLTCAERHLAVVHPIIYLSLKKRGGVRIRNFSIGCAWLLILGSFGLTSVGSNSSTIPFFCLLVASTVAVCFCSLSVLRALVHPGPGDGGKDRERVGQSKMRAFHTIATITGTLMFRLGGHVLVLSIYSSSAVGEHVGCPLLISGVWFCLPSSLVLPLLFLQRARKLQCCRNETEATQRSQ